MKVDNREAPFSDAEGGSKAMRDKVRAYEDKSDEADESLRKMEADLKAQYRPKGEAPSAGATAAKVDGKAEARGHQVEGGKGRHDCGSDQNPQFGVLRNHHADRAAEDLRTVRATVRWRTRYGRGAAAGSGSGIHLRFGRRRSVEPGRGCHPGFLQAVAGNDKPAEIPLWAKFGTAAGFGRMDWVAGESADCA
jgi:hypothetical protein